MKPIISFSEHDKSEWLEGCAAALSPTAFLHEMRLRLLNETTRRWNEVDAGLTTYIDEDGDLAYQITDLAKQYSFYKSHAYPINCRMTPEEMAANLAGSAFRAKQHRQTIREIAASMKQVLPEYPRLTDLPVDILPAKTLNAWARPVPGSGDVIGINEQFTECWVWCEWFAWRWLESPDSPLMNLVQPIKGKSPSPESRARLLRESKELASAMMGLYPDSGLLIEQYAEDLKRKGKNKRGDFYAKTMTTIAILHEFGHVVLGHTDWLRELIEDYVRGKPTRLSVHQMRAQQRSNEYAADEFAAQVLMRFNKPTETQGLRNNILGWSAQMLFMMFHFAQTFEVFDDVDPEATHPTPVNRISAFLQQMGIH